jgi:hypothetical protein
VAVATVILCSLVDRLTLQAGVVAIKTGYGLFRSFRMRVVAFLTVELKDGGMNDRTCLLSLVARFTGSSLLNDGQEPRLKGAVRVVASDTFVSENHRAVFATFQFRVAFQAQGRHIVEKMVFKVRAVGTMAVVTAVFGSGMIVPGVHYPGVALKAANGISRSGGMRIMAAVAFGIAYRCVLVFGYYDIHMARCAGGS